MSQEDIDAPSMFNNLDKHLNEITNFMRTPKNAASFAKLQRDADYDDQTKQTQNLDRNNKKANVKQTISDTNVKEQLSQNSHRNSKKANIKKKTKKSKKSVKPKKSKKSVKPKKSKDKNKKPTFWELNGMVFKIQDVSHALFSVMNSVFYNGKNKHKCIEYKHKSLTINEVFNDPIVYNIDYNQHSKLNRTQFKLKQHKYCYNCYKIITFLSSHQIYKCMKCKFVTYCSKECRIANKKYHSYSCSVMDTIQIQRIANISSSKCIQHITENIKDPTWKFVFYLRRLHYILRFGETSKSKLFFDDIGLELHRISRMYNARPSLWIRYINIFWSCYGMPEFLLSTPFIRENRFNVYEKYDFPPNYLKLNDWSYDEYEEWYEQNFNSNNDIYYLSFFISNMLCNTITNESTKPIFRAPASSVWVFRDSSFLSIDEVPMFDVVIKRILELYTDIHVINDCGDSFCSLSNVIEKLFVNNDIFNVYQVIGCNLNYILLNTTFMDSIVNEMTTANNKRPSTNMFKYVVENIDCQFLWDRDKYVASYYILLINDAIQKTKQYLYESYNQTKENDHNIKLTEEQLKYARICINKMMPKQCGNKLFKSLNYISTWILLHHYQQPRGDSIDEWRITMSCHQSFIKFAGKNNLLSCFNHYSFDFIINDMFFWNFVYFYAKKCKFDLKLLMKYFKKEKSNETIFEVLRILWRSIEYNYHINEFGTDYDYDQRRNNKMIIFILSKCIHRNEFKDNYKFWMDIKSKDNVIHNKTLKHERDRKYPAISKICASPICSNTLKRLRKKNKDAIFYKCKKCRNFYCCRMCQKIHWKYGHKIHCKLSTINLDSILNQCLDQFVV